MADEMVASTITYDGEALRVQSLAVDAAENVTINLSLPSPLWQNPWDAAEIVTAIANEFMPAASIVVEDLTTGVDYNFSIQPGSANYNYFYVQGVDQLVFSASSETAEPVQSESVQSPCFASGTELETLSGRRAVEDLKEGDIVVLASGSTARVTWIGHRRAKNARVVRFRRHSFGPNMPSRDLCVSHDHAMLVDDVLVPAYLLVNGQSVLEECWAEVIFYHVELPVHGILLAEGAMAESYLDTGNRTQFGNCPLSYEPSHSGGNACAEMVVAGARLAQAISSLPIMA